MATARLCRMMKMPHKPRTTDTPEEKLSPSDSRIEKRLRNKALHYLGRYSSTSYRLKQVLIRFAARKLETVSQDRLMPAISKIIEDCQRLGYVDDRQFALSKIRTGRTQGQSRATLLQKLLQSGLDSNLISELLTPSSDGRLNHDPHTAELLACLISARRKRIGPFSRTLPLTPEEKKKHLGKLARAGFSHTHAHQVIALQNQQEAEELLSETRTEI